MFARWSLPRCVRRAAFFFIIAINAGYAHASEFDATALSARIRELHMPYGTVLDPVFASADPSSPDFARIVSYSRAGDSALWTGHFVAAEAFRYQVTRSAEALDNVWRGLRGIHALLDITGTNLLARCLVPVDSPYAADIQKAEGGHGIYFSKYQGNDYFWIGNTSRDQYSGVMFGLGAAYDLVDDPAVRDFVHADVRRILDFLLDHNWNVVTPDRRISTTFKLRPDQQLSFLQIGRLVDAAAYGERYLAYGGSLAGAVILPILYDDVDEHAHYFKFNLNYINLYSLLKFEELDSPLRRTYLDAYWALRRRTQSHGNAHFNMIDRFVRGPDADREAETAGLLAAWLQRPRRDYWIDLRAKYPACGNEDQACDPIPVEERVNTDFLWQRSPFLLYGGGFGTMETPGIDYILPYWMARSVGVVE